ncbi:MAG TPA: ABC transporter permease [Nitrososphaerales archaeon]|nr:ABC transporter permease [Nitrososphaerales archaeon]
MSNSKPAKKERGASQGAVAWRRFRKNRSALAGGVIVGFFVFMSVYGVFFAPLPPRNFLYCLTNGCANLPPFTNWAHPLGTEPSGIDVYSEILHGALGDLYVGVVATAISILIGLVVGALAGYRGGVSGALLLGVTQIFFVLPVLILILLFARIGQLLVAHGLGLTLIVVILGIFGWPTIAYVTRGEILRIKELEFVQAAKSLGASNTRILFRHILLNVLSPIIVLSSLLVAGNILTEVVISFLGFGDPSTSTWGLLLQEGFSYVRTSWWVSLFPGIAVVIAVLGFNLLGDGLADALNPRIRE